MSAIGENPYVGAQPLTPKNPLFGRDREVRDLYFLLSKERIVLMYAPSGAGKSSLLEGGGGLLDQMYERFHVWPVTRVNTEPSVPCKNRYVLSALLGFERAAPPEHMRSEDQLAGLTLREGVMSRWRHPDDPSLILLTFDQFEEIVRLNPTDIDGQREFFHQLGDLLAEPSIWALLVMREDYLAVIDPYCRQVPTHLRNRFRLDLLSGEAARDAIAKTAETAGRYWEKEAVDRVVADLALVKYQPMQGDPYFVPGQYVEPLHLQVVCRDLWDRLAPDDESFGLDDLESIGNVDLALASYYSRSVHEIAEGESGAERALREWVAKQLITAGHVRGQVLREKNLSGGLPNAVIEKMVSKHLVRAEKRAGATWYELAHDRLIAPVEADNQQWFQANLSPLERRVALWLAQGRSVDLLATGGMLREFRRWAKLNRSRVQEHERSYLFLSQLEDGKVWFRRGLISCVVAAALVAGWNWLEAKSEKDKALYNEAVGYSSRADEAIGRGKPEEAWLYTLASLRGDWSDDYSLPESFGRLLRSEFYPSPNWRERQKVAVGSVAYHSKADRLLWVSSTSKTVNHTSAVLQKFVVDNFEVYLSVPDEHGKASFNSLFLYNLKNPGPFGANFTGDMLCVVAGDKRYYAGGNHLVEEEALVRPGSGRRLETGVSPVIALQATDRGIGVLTKDGRLRFANAGTMSWEAGEWSLPSDGLVGFDVAGDKLAAAYKSSGKNPSKVAVWSLREKNQLEDAGSLDAEWARVVAIVQQSPLIVAYGTAFGEVGLIHLPYVSGVRLAARTTMHSSAVVQLTRVGASANDDDLLSVSDTGEVRRIQMRVRPLNDKEDSVVWQLASEPREDATKKFFDRLQTESLKIFPFRWEPPKFVTYDAAKLTDATAEMFGRESRALFRQFPGSALNRFPDGRWTWSSLADSIPLVEKRREAGTFVLGLGNLEFRVPPRVGDWLTVNGIELARVAHVSPERIMLTSGYFYPTSGGRWQLGAAGEVSRQVWTERGAMPNGDLNLTTGENGASLILPKHEGRLLFRADPVSEPVAVGDTVVTLVYKIADPWVSPSSPHRIRYKNVRTNGEENTAYVEPGQPVFVNARWEIDAASDSKLQQNFLLGIVGPGTEYSKCVASYGGPRQSTQRESGIVQMKFFAPSKPGWYFVTHASQEGDKCEANWSLHASGPEYAVAAIRVKEGRENDRPR